MRTMILLAFALCSCATDPPPEYGSEVPRVGEAGHAQVPRVVVANTDTKLLVYVQEFYDEALTREVKVFVNFRGAKFNEVQVKIGDVDAVGYCDMTSAEAKGKSSLVETDIHILRPEWDEKGPFWRLALMYHELGHCLLQREHAVQGQMDLMVPLMEDEEVYADNWEYLVNELFTVNH